LEIRDISKIKVVCVTSGGNINTLAIKNARIIKQLSLRELSCLVNRSKSVISRYESGVYIPRMWVALKRICIALNISATDILGVNSSPDSNNLNLHLLKQYRVQYNKLSLKDLSDKLGSPAFYSYINKCENGKRVPPSWVVLKKLSVVLGLSPDDILNIRVNSKNIKNDALFNAIKIFVAN
jgi:transcriptional regulator with XRE-family HTH domain